MAISSIRGLLPGQPNGGTITYGNYTFGVAGKYEIIPELVYDESDRVVSYVKYLLRCTNCYITPQGSAGSPVLNDQVAATALLEKQITTIHDTLSMPGLPLTVKDIGFDVLISTGAVAGVNPTWELCWGAKPRTMRFRPHGTVCWEFDWECEFCLSRCLYAGVGPGTDSVLAFNYDMTFVIDQEGLTQRITSGYFQVAAIRNPNLAAQQLVLFNVDNVWDSVSVAVPYGFRRTQNVRSINKAKNRIDFTITDTELNSDAYPAGIVEADVDYELASSPPGLAKFNGTLSGSLTVAPGYPKALALSKYLLILNAKVQELRQISIDSGQKAKPIPIAMSLSHGLFTRTTRFSVTFMLAADVNTLLQESGMWNVLPGTDYSQWATSMEAAGVWGNRGVAGLKFDNTEDRLLTICSPAPVPQLANDQSSHPFDNTGNQSGTANNQPDETGDYLLYKNDVKPYKSENFIVHRYAQGYSPGGGTTVQDHVVQYQTAPDCYVWMIGSAARLDKLPAIPQLQSVGGLDVELVYQEPQADTAPTTLAFGHKLFRSAWALLYRIKGVPAQSAATGQYPTSVMQSPEPLLGQLS